MQCSARIGRTREPRRGEALLDVGLAFALLLVLLMGRVAGRVAAAAERHRLRTRAVAWFLGRGMAAELGARTRLPDRLPERAAELDGILRDLARFRPDGSCRAPLERLGLRMVRVGRGPGARRTLIVSGPGARFAFELAAEVEGPGAVRGDDGSGP